MAIIAPGLPIYSTAPALPRPPFAAGKQESALAKDTIADAVRARLADVVSMSCQVAKIENGYVIGISDGRGSMARLIYATDLTDVGQQITAFAVTMELEGKGAKT